MIEVRNNLLRTTFEIDTMAAYLGELISAALAAWKVPVRANRTGGRP